jgi:aminoglycoside phosphotransferase (APT) family kinase protein
MTSTSVGKHPTALHLTGLPILQVVLNVERMTEKLAPLLVPLAGPDGPPPVTYAKLLAYKQGNRGTIRYQVATEGSPTTVLGKLYPQASQAARVDAILQGLAGAFAATPDLGAPRPLGCLPDLAMLVYVPVEGEVLDEVLQADDGRAASAIEHSAAWLATLHRARFELDRRFQPSLELVNLQAWGALVSQAHPDLAATVTRLTDRLQGSVARLAFRDDTPIHKDFHYKHVLVDGGLRVIDFDEVRLGDPAYDVAHFCVHLRLLACRTLGDPAGYADFERAFLLAYTRRAGTVPRDRYAWFATYTCVKIAKQLCTTRGVRPRPDGEELRRQVRVMLAQGLAYSADLP